MKSYYYFLQNSFPQHMRPCGSTVCSSKRAYEKCDSSAQNGHWCQEREGNCIGRAYRRTHEETHYFLQWRQIRNGPKNRKDTSRILRHRSQGAERSLSVKWSTVPNAQRCPVDLAHGMSCLSGNLVSLGSGLVRSKARRWDIKWVWGKEMETVHTNKSFRKSMET